MAKTKIELTPENSIAGVLKENIRKAFFTKHLPEILAEIQINNPTVEDVRELEIFLLSLKSNDTDLFKRLSEALGEEALGIEKSANIPLAKFLGDMTPAEKESFETWRSNCLKVLMRIDDLLAGTRDLIKQRSQMSKDDWVDIALEIATLSKWVDEDRVYKDQMFNKLKTEIRVTQGCSRIEAEEIAKTSQEYRDYKLATLRKDNLNEFIMLCKKKGNVDL